MGNNLATRAAGAAEQAVNGGRPTLNQLIEQMKPQIARALPKHMDADRLARIAMTLLKQTPKLGQCTPESFLGALMTASQLGLEPGPLGEAYLVPYGNTVQFIPGYRGLIKLAWQSGQMKNIDAHVVYEHDEFDYEYGLNPFLRHKPTRGTRGKVTDVYAVATLQNGGSAFVVMSLEDVAAIRKRSKSSGNGPWVTDWDAMAKKTAVKQLIRWLPLSTELQTLNHAADLDGTVREDVTELPEADVDYIDAEPQAIEPAPSDDRSDEYLATMAEES
jgi:recombination protein RecT